MSTLLDKTTIDSTGTRSHTELGPAPALPTGVPKVSVIVPTLNEAENLPIVFGMLPDGLHEVIVVDGRSTDDTIEVAKRLRPDVKIVLEERPGKGHALAAGFAAATGDILVMLDADGSADPAEIERYIQPLLEGADFAKGSRFLPGGGSSDITPLRRLGNAVLCGITNHWFGTSYSDLCYGYNAFWRHCLPAMDVDCAGFEVETLINIRIAKAGLKIAEVPSFEFDRIHGESNLNAFKDGLRVLRTILKERFLGDTRRSRRSSDERPTDEPASVTRLADRRRADADVRLDAAA
ncbi:MAG: glycosyltransferase family 2 protein [Actinomyces sp.]|nr:MAG: glycosyltransferase family 2 protein [Actinomyces sp.]